MDNVNDIDKHFSLRTLRFSLRLVGLWPGKNTCEQLLSDILLFNTVALMIIALMIVTIDLYWSWGDLHAVSHNAPNTTTVTIELLTLTQFVLNRSEVMKFNAYTEKTFWKIPYDAVEHQILNKCNRQSLTMIVIYMFFAQSIIWLFLTIPIVASLSRILERLRSLYKFGIISHIEDLKCLHILFVQFLEEQSAGRNTSERTLPFDLHLDLPLTQTPYYEMTFLMEAAGLVSVGLCNTGFAGFLCTMNLYAAGQFRILQRKLELTCCNDKAISSFGQTSINCITNSSNRWQVLHPFYRNKLNHTNFAKVLKCHSCAVDYIWAYQKIFYWQQNFALKNIMKKVFILIAIKDVSENSKSNNQSISTDDCRAIMMKGVEYNILKDCIKQHQLLLDYMERVENLSSTMMLAQALGSILKMCFSGFQILLVGGTSILRTILSIQFLVASLFLFLMFSWSSHEIIIESQAIGEAIYRASWYRLPYTSEGKACRQALLIIIARARKPCTLTVGKFAPMSLQTFASVFNTSISYFTILRQMNEQIED